jgi:hypothetical protein
MKDSRRNRWNLPTGHDTFLNGALIAVGFVGLMLNILASGGVA